jgi:hypothetical protein
VTVDQYLRNWNCLVSWPPQAGRELLLLLLGRQLSDCAKSPDARLLELVRGTSLKMGGLIEMLQVKPPVLWTTHSSNAETLWVSLDLALFESAPATS